jgi:hypothetical protein
VDYSSYLNFEITTTIVSFRAWDPSFALGQSAFNLAYTSVTINMVSFNPATIQDRIIQVVIVAFGNLIEIMDLPETIE